MADRHQWVRDAVERVLRSAPHDLSPDKEQLLREIVALELARAYARGREAVKRHVN
jgi:hypothetical protein